MKEPPSFEDIFAVMSAASIGDASPRVPLPENPQPDHLPTRFATALNILLDDLAFRAEAAARSADQLRCLVDASREFTAASHHGHLFDTVARRLALVIHDYCAVWLASDDGGELRRAALHANDPDVEERARRVIPERLRFEQHPVARQVHESGRRFVVAKIDWEGLRAATPREYFEFLQAIGLHSLLVVPLRVRERPIGQVVLLRYRPESGPFDERDLELAGALADHAALTIANAQSYAIAQSARAVAEEATNSLKASEMRYRLMFDNSPLPKWLYDLETLRFLEVNDAAISHYGYSREEFLAMTLKDIRPPEDLPALMESVISPTVTPKFGVWRHRQKSGEVILVEVTTHTFSLGDRQCRLAVARDITERTRLEEQLRQAQKMEAVGRLAGGIAHDFNNALSVVLSYGAMLIEDLKPQDPIREDLQEIRKAAQRAADMTRQLLMFSRQQVIEPKVVDLNGLLAGMDKMLRRIVGEDVELASIAADSLGRVRVDPGSIEQVIMNLVVNARDAMPTGGQLTLETANVALDEEYAKQHLAAKPGLYVMLAVSDSGVGMDRATQARIFEPFFTTKEKGKGTGLGLSTVFGIVQQCGGNVWVYSEPGKGTTFKIYLPRIDAEVQEIRMQPLQPRLDGTETVLLVEDEDQVRAVARTILRKHGYQVLEARNAGEAILLCEQYKGTIHLLLSDVVMPQMSGPEMARRIATMRPEMRVLCMSGYTDDAALRHGVVESEFAYLQKPITVETLTRKVREVLDAPRAR